MEELSVRCLSWDRGWTLSRQDGSSDVLQTLLQWDLRATWSECKQQGTLSKLFFNMLHVVALALCCCVRTCACRRGGPVRGQLCQSYDSSRSSATGGPYYELYSGPAWSYASDVLPSMENSPGPQRQTGTGTNTGIIYWCAITMTMLKGIFSLFIHKCVEV